MFISLNFSLCASICISCIFVHHVSTLYSAWQRCLLFFLVSPFSSIFCRRSSSWLHISDFFLRYQFPLFTLPHANLLASLHFSNYLIFKFSHPCPLCCQFHGLFLWLPGDLSWIPLRLLNNLESIVLGIKSIFRGVSWPWQFRGWLHIPHLWGYPHAFHVCAYVCIFILKRDLSHPTLAKRQVDLVPAPSVPVPRVVKDGSWCRQPGALYRCRPSFHGVCIEHLLSTAVSPWIPWTDRTHTGLSRLDHQGSFPPSEIPSHRKCSVQNFLCLPDLYVPSFFLFLCGHVKSMKNVDFCVVLVSRELYWTVKVKTAPIYSRGLVPEWGAGSWGGERSAYCCLSGSLLCLGQQRGHV